MIEIFDISPLLHNNNDYSHDDNKIEALYTIGTIRETSKIYTYFTEEDHFHFNEPHGIGYSEGKGILAISDRFNRRVEIYKIRRNGYEHHSFISLPFLFLERIAISSPGDIILVMGDDRVGKYYIKMFVYEEEEGEKNIRWREEGEIRPPPSLHPPLTSPSGIAIHSPLNYCVICDYNNDRILFFNITTRDLICSYQPTLPPLLPPSSSPYSPWGISIDEEADLICVSEHSNIISIFHAPIF